ncbi:hypothetical protein BRADI_1g33508v3 [Brachypodium distachyon]|uniref:Uncharacterized protein n=1 Tax=Brachypodium distachyon TaxID=15368 RepID=A0A2K2DMI6_BRADI|nr:hypothetical protein BRADI_1g33508v3 [Brachypodium distachyon]
MYYQLRVLALHMRHYYQPQVLHMILLQHPW